MPCALLALRRSVIIFTIRTDMPSRTPIIAPLAEIAIEEVLEVEISQICVY